MYAHEGMHCDTCTNVSEMCIRDRLILNLSEQPHIFLHFVMCGIDVRRRICLVTIQKAKNEELVGDKSTVSYTHLVIIINQF